MSHDVPAYDAHVLRPKAADYCVCVFVINEGDRLRSQLRRMNSLVGRVDVVVADGGSTDGSTDLDFLHAAGVSALLVKTGPGKLSAQMRMAFDFALRAGYRGVVVIGRQRQGRPGRGPRHGGKIARRLRPRPGVAFRARRPGRQHAAGALARRATAARAAHSAWRPAGTAPTPPTGFAVTAAGCWKTRASPRCAPCSRLTNCTITWRSARPGWGCGRAKCR